MSIDLPVDSPVLSENEPSPVLIRNPGGQSALLLLADHAGRTIPHGMAGLGVTAAEMERHIAWDIGIDAVGALLSEALDAVMIGQRYSRLVIDCNRPPGHATSIPEVSDGTVVPGNIGLDPASREARRLAIFEPYHAAIRKELDARDQVRGSQGGQPCAVIALHSFTPVFGGAVRPWEAGILHDRDPEFGLEVGRLLQAAGLLVGDNEPYQLSDSSDYTVPVHAEGRGLPYLELEIRQDLIADAAGQRRWAALLARVLPEAWARFQASLTSSPP